MLLINDSLAHATLAMVHAGAGGRPGALERLLAPSAYATGGVTLGGVGFGARSGSGTLPPVRPTTVSPRAGAYAVSLPPASAALLTLPAGGHGE